ncbi:hypothetical protein OQA88_6362 [Cercophora sp. LCS_1]
MSKETHIERTAHEPRDLSLHQTTITRITQINPTIRLFRLSITSPKGIKVTLSSQPKRTTPTNTSIQFLPGQWLDVYIPSLPKPGGFTITSPPSLALPSPSHAHTPYLELAIQQSPDNPPAAWLWQPVPQILHAPINVRVGGSFIWPPPVINLSTLKKAVFIAGGVGVNPLMSMLSAIAKSSPPLGFEVHFLYSMRDPGADRDGKGMLFLERIAGIFAQGGLSGGLRLFLTQGRGVSDEDDDKVHVDELDVPFLRRRICLEDVASIIGDDKDSSVVYVCGVPAMTDEFVEKLLDPDGLGMDSRRALFEKWW